MRATAFDFSKNEHATSNRGVNKSMNLLFAIDDRFSEQLKTTLYSIKRHTTAASFDVYVLQENELRQGAEL